MRGSEKEKGLEVLKHPGLGMSKVPWGWGASSRYLVNRLKEFLSDNLLWARPLIKVLPGSLKGGAEVSFEPETKIAFSSK